MEHPRTRLITTGDGSSSLELVGVDETYHSRHGALTESHHVFIKAGLDAAKRGERLRIFEMGFGTGLNALLSFRWSKEMDVPITFRTIEAFPLPEETWSALRFPEMSPEDVELFGEIHKSAWGSPAVLDEQRILWKEHVRLEDFNPGAWKADVIFYDAFGPRTQSELWDLPRMVQMYELLDENGLLVTYCAQGQFRRNLKEAGFEVEKLDGPPGKREMTRAWKRV